MSAGAVVRVAVYLASIVLLPWAVDHDWTDAGTAEQITAALAAAAVPALAAANINRQGGRRAYVGKRRAR